MKQIESMAQFPHVSNIHFLGHILALYLFLCTCSSATNVRVESGDMSLWVTQQGMNLSSGPEKIIVNADFGLANQNGKYVFPDKASYEFAQSDITVTKRTKINPYVKAEIIHKVFTNGVRVDITAEILPNAGLRYERWDIYLARSVFAYATVRDRGASGKSARHLVGRLDPKDWKTIAVDTLSITTTNGEWTFTLDSDTPVKWKLLSDCKNQTRGLAEEMRTFHLQYMTDKVSPEGMKENLSFEARFTPKPGVVPKSEDPFAGKVCTYLRTLLARYGPPTIDAKGPKLLPPLRSGVPLSVQTQQLASQVCLASANLEASRLDSRAGTVIPEPKSYKRFPGTFIVPTSLGIACATNHDAAIEVLTEDLAQHGVQVSRVELSAKTPFLMGVLTKDLAVTDACKRLGVMVDEKIPGPEGYILVVTPQQVVIAGSDDAGVLYGAQTFRQLIRTGANGAEIPVVVITDHPDMKFRGFYVEGGGNIANTEQIRRLIRNTYSYFKANTIVLRVYWNRFRWRSHPEVGVKDALPLDDLAATIAYARRFHIEVIPSVVTYGKVQDLFQSHPEIAEDPSWKEKRESAYCPNKPETYPLIFDMMKEIIAATQCRRIHIGHDEIMGMALCPICQKIPPSDLFANDVNKIAGWLAEQNVETMIWGDMLLDSARWGTLGVSAAHSGHRIFSGHLIHPGLAKIRKDVIITDWHYGGTNTYPTIKHFADNRFRVIGCPWYDKNNNFYLTQAVKAANQMGILVTDWGFLQVRAPGASSIVGIVCAWNTATPEPASLSWSPEAVLTASILDKAKPSRLRGTTFAPIPIEPVGNRLLSGEAPAWFGMGARHDLSYLPSGPHRLFGIDYLIGKKCVVVDDKVSTLRIAVNAKAKSLVFLHALSIQDPAIVWRKTYGRYRVTYTSGEKIEVAINTFNVNYWLSDAPRTDLGGRWTFAYTWESILAWEGCTKTAEAVNLQAYEWVNPRPDDPVSAIEVIADSKIPGIQIGLVALTAVQ